MSSLVCDSFSCSGALVEHLPGTGCGINVLNPRPTTSLSQLTSSALSMEQVLGTIVPVFQSMWEEFLGANGSFAPFVDLYLDRWLHSYVILHRRIGNKLTFFIEISLLH